jgi:hypothetical protein
MKRYVEILLYKNKNDFTLSPKALKLLYSAAIYDFSIENTKFPREKYAKNTTIKKQNKKTKCSSKTV